MTEKLTENAISPEQGVGGLQRKLDRGAVTSITGTPLKTGISDSYVQSPIFSSSSRKENLQI